MVKHRFLILVLCCFCVILSGCATLSKNKSDTEVAMLEPQAIVKFNDIPIPSGFRSVPGDSYSFEAYGIRVGLLKYEGKANIEQVVNFYREQMVMYNWNLLNLVEYGQRILNFDRDNETCIITLIPRGNNVVSTISIGPKARRVIRQTKQPVK